MFKMYKLQGYKISRPKLGKLKFDKNNYTDGHQ